MRRYFLIGLALALALTVIATIQPGSADKQMEQRTNGVAAPATRLSNVPSVYPLTSVTEDTEEDRRVRHSRTVLVLTVAGELWAGIVLATLLLTGRAVKVRRLAERLTGGRAVTLGVGALVTLIVAVASFPFTYTQRLVSLHYGISHQAFGPWLVDVAKATLVNVVGAALLFGVVYRIIRHYPRRWWLPAGFTVVLLTVVVATLYPIVIDPFLTDFQPLPDPNLKTRLETLAARGGIQVADVVMAEWAKKTNALNAYFSGIGPTQRIVVPDTTLRALTPAEIEAIVAHEMGHQVHHDTLRYSLWIGLFYLAGFYLLYRFMGTVIDRLHARLGFNRLSDPASIPLFMLLLGFWFFVAQPIQNTASRIAEHQADQYALDLTHDNQAFISAFQKLMEVNVSDPNPPRWIEIVFYDHPSLGSRIEFARHYHPWTSQD